MDFHRCVDHDSASPRAHVVSALVQNGAHEALVIRDGRNGKDGAPMVLKVPHLCNAQVLPSAEAIAELADHPALVFQAPRARDLQA